MSSTPSRRQRRAKLRTRRVTSSQEDRMTVFSRDVGHALERFGAAGGSLEHAGEALLRMCAQTLQMAPTAWSEERFVSLARAIWTATARELDRAGAR